ncbi:MAG: recombination protein RecR [Desulfovibrio sp.]|nr:recombination protein RecR [Desulfovibrio sp.]
MNDSPHIPEVLSNLVKQLGTLPGLGPKSAMRVAMTMLEWPAAKTKQLGQSIFTLRDELGLCSRCGGLTQTDPCPICADPNRSRHELCLVSEWDSMLTIDQGGFYHGQYLVLGGLLVPLEQKDSSKLHTDKLIKRLAEGEVSEVILALGATTDAETTTSWLLKVIKDQFPQVQVSRLAQGLPLGAEVKYMDRETLRQSLLYRQSL